MGKARRKLQRRRARLHKEQGGKCHYCNCDTVLGGYHVTGSPPPKNQATIEHLYPRGHPMRGQNNKPATVVACWACNNERGQKEVYVVSIPKSKRVRLRDERQAARVRAPAMESEDR